MKKTVTVNGQKIKVDFINTHVSRDIDSYDIKTNSHIFKIDSEEYELTSISKRGKSGKFSTTYNYKGITFPDSEKKIIEFILNH